MVSTAAALDYNGGPIPLVPTMKLATLHDGALDGRLAVVACQLTNVHIADGIVPTLEKVKSAAVQGPADFANIKPW